MIITEFEIISKYFSHIIEPDASIDIGIGDDAAVVSVPESHQLVLCMDTLVAGVHFPEETKAFDIAYKALAVNLSDIAAMGATPKWFTLALTLPESDEPWLKNFSEGLAKLAKRYQISLIGGDITKGALTITIQVHGLVPKNQALTRNNAKVGDKIFVTGQLGDAAFAVKLLKNRNEVSQSDYERLLLALNRPDPCIEQGIRLRGIASSCIDISDGLLADLGHLLEKSEVGAKIDSDKIPVSPLLKYYLNKKTALQYATTGGDDYQLCFTVPADKMALLDEINFIFPCGVSCIGQITKQKSLMIDNHIFQDKKKGYEHF